MAKSLAFWLEGSKSNDTSIELHFNFWLLNMGSKNEINYLDVGVKFKSLENISSINIFFPFEIRKNSYIHNLGRILSKDGELISAIFNARIYSLTYVDSNVLDIRFMDDNKVLRVFSQIELSEQSGSKGVNITYQDGGAILSFPKTLITCEIEKPTAEGNEAKDKDNEVFGYFRFRINLNSEDRKSISQLYVSKDAKFLSRMESIEVVDFRVNEVRNLPQKIVSNLSTTCINSVHFFLIRETNSEHKLSHSEFKRCRILEKNLWDKYLNVPSSTSIPDQMLIYHWKEQNEKKYLDNFSAFAKFSTITVTWGTVAYFLGFLLLWGAASGVLGNFIYSLPQRFAVKPIENKTLLMDNETKPESPQQSKPE